MTLPPRSDGSLEALTAKQRAVLDLLIQHKTSKEISRILGISPHTVDQRIMLARGKLQVASRAEVAQAYRVLLEQEPPGNSYEKPVYGSPDVANDPVAMHKGREEHDEVSASEEAVPSDGEILDSSVPHGGLPEGEYPVGVYPDKTVPDDGHLADGAMIRLNGGTDGGDRPVTIHSGDSGQQAASAYRVLPEVFDGPHGTLMRLVAMALIAMILILTVLGGLTMFSQLSRIVDR